MSRRLSISPSSFSAAELKPAVLWLQRGGVVAFPTDTFYGLAVDPRSPHAVDALFDVKGRAADQAVPLIAGSEASVAAFCGPLDERTSKLAARFWPGPLSIVVDAPAAIAPAVHGGHGTIAIRVPDLPLARAFALACGLPITATSANRSGQPPVSDAGRLDDVVFDERVFVIDGGSAPGGRPSTIVDARGGEPKLIRAGAVEWGQIMEVLGLQS